MRFIRSLEVVFYMTLHFTILLITSFSSNSNVWCKSFLCLHCYAPLWLHFLLSWHQFQLLSSWLIVHGTVMLYTTGIKSLRQYAALRFLFFKTNFWQSVTDSHFFLWTQQQLWCKSCLWFHNILVNASGGVMKVSVFFSLIAEGEIEEKGRIFGITGFCWLIIAILNVMQMLMFYIYIYIYISASFLDTDTEILDYEYIIYNNKCNILIWNSMHAFYKDPLL